MILKRSNEAVFNKSASSYKSLDFYLIMKAKLVNTKAELQGGKKLTNQEADRMMKKLDEVKKMLPTTEGNLWDY